MQAAASASPITTTTTTTTTVWKIVWKSHFANQGCHVSFNKAKSAKFGLFWSCLPELKWFGHLAFFECRRIKYILRPVLEKTYNILWNFKICSSHLNKFSKNIWPLFGLFPWLRIWLLLKLLMAKFRLFHFFGPGNPVANEELQQSTKTEADF